MGGLFPTHAISISVATGLIGKVELPDQIIKSHINH